MSEQALAPIVIMAGGTGGHIFPALAVAKSLQAEACSVTWIGTPNSMEARLVPEHGVPIRFINIKALRGKGVLAKLLLPMRLLVAITQALMILHKLKPAAVLGMGGFVTGPGGIAAWLMRKPLLVHEQNAVAGMTNRYLARMAKHIYEAFPGSFGKNKHAVECVGNPIRNEIALLHQEVKEAFNSEQTLQVLIVGGSLGALALNKTVPQAFAELFKSEQFSANRVRIRHQAGERTIAQAKQAYADAGVEAQVISFIDDMAAAYRWADLIICRAGALTVSELAAAGVPAVFVPFPHAVDDHQTKNANYLVNAGAAKLIAQDDLSAQSLSECLLSFVQNPSRLQEMSKRAKSAANLHASHIIAKQCLEYARAAA